MCFQHPENLISCPDIDVVIPTLNSEHDIEFCLKNIKKQRYRGNLNIIIVDGGSTDKTVDISNAYNCKVYTKRGAYMNGIEGAYNFGMKHSTSEYIFRMDSDNFLVGEEFFSDLVKPMMEDNSINISISVPISGPNANCFEQFGVINDRGILYEIAKRGNMNEKFYVVEDLDYGLTNAALFRRSVYERVGGFISDISFLISLRANALSKTAINFGANFYHPFPSYHDYIKKMYKRFRKIASLTDSYEIKYKGKRKDYEKMNTSLHAYIKSILFAAKGFLEYKDKIHFCGLILSITPILIIAIAPLSSLKIYFRYLRNLFS